MTTSAAATPYEGRRSLKKRLALKPVNQNNPNPKSFKNKLDYCSPALHKTLHSYYYVRHPNDTQPSRQPPD